MPWVVESAGTAGRATRLDGPAGPGDVLPDVAAGRLAAANSLVRVVPESQRRGADGSFMLERSAEVDQPVLRIAGAHYAYGGRTALDGIDLEVRAGEIYALLGPNGAGKTTLVRAVCGRLDLGAGRTRVLDRDPRRDPAARAAIGLVPQEIALFAQLTARENLEVLGRLMGVRSRALAAAVDGAIALTQIAERAEQIVATLSGGWRRRVNIAAGVLHGPRLLVLDEPTVGVDLDARAAIHVAVERLRDAGMAILMVTHDFEQAAALADRIGILVRGRLVREGATEALIAGRFGTARRAILTLAGAEAADARARLAAEGLRPEDGGRGWIAETVHDHAAAATLSARLEAAGFVVTEIAMREPSLADFFAAAVAEAEQAGR